MKAIVCSKYGPPDVLQLQEIKKPILCDNEILIQVYATSVTTADKNIRSFTVPFGFWLISRLAFGLIKPKKSILGTEFSGKVECIGKDVKLFKVGDPIFGSTGSNFGAYAEYLCQPEESALTKKPANITFEEAATIPFGALTALYFLRNKGNIHNGQKILIYGASGGVGTAAVQLAKYYGANITGVCSSTNMKLVKSLGAEKVIDYTKENFTNGAETYDIILDILGKSSFSHCKNVLKKNGKYLLVTAGLPQFIQMLWTSQIGSKKVICGMAPDKSEDLIFLKGLIESGELKSNIDRCYQFEQIVEAHKYVEKGHKKGNVAISLKQNISDNEKDISNL